jgi:hypothetical protein
MASILDFMNKYNDENYPPVKDFQIISLTGSRHRLQGRMEPFTSGSDQEVYDHLGIPGTFVVTWPERYYHSSKDTPEMVDPTQLHRSVFSGLAAMSVLAYADDDQAISLSQLSSTYGRRLIAEDEARATNLVVSSGRDSFSSNEELAELIVHHAFQREEAAIRSCEAFSRTRPTRQAIEESVAMLNADEEGDLHRLRVAAERQGERIGAKADGRRKPTPAELEAARQIPRRLKDQQLAGWSFAANKMAADQAAEVAMVRKAIADAAETMRIAGNNDLRIMSLDDAPAYYVDGRRSILDIHDAIAAEYTPIPLNVLEVYFRLLEKAGVMNIAQDGSAVAANTRN